MTGRVVDRMRRIVDLAHADEPGSAALEMARFAYPDLEVDRWLEWFDQAAARVDGADHLALRKVISISEGIGGNVDDYYDPDNSFLNRVIETRKGIPIALSVIWMEVGRRVGIDVEGIGLPGHFLIRVGGQLVDPFHYGEAIGLDEAASLVGAALGQTPVVRESHLAPVGTPMIIARMAHNLRRIYRERDDELGFGWTTRLLREFTPQA